MFLFLVCMAIFFHDGLVNVIGSSLGSGVQISSGSLNTISLVLYLLFAGIILVSIIAILIGLIISFLDYKNYTFKFEEFDLIVRRGFLNKEQTSIPYRQIQDTDIEQSLIYQAFGVSRVVIITAGHENSGMNDNLETVLEPIDTTLAEEIRGALQSRIGVQVVESEKEAEIK